MHFRYTLAGMLLGLTINGLMCGAEHQEHNDRKAFAAASKRLFVPVADDIDVMTRKLSATFSNGLESLTDLRNKKHARKKALRINHLNPRKYEKNLHKRNCTRD